MKMRVLATLLLSAVFVIAHQCPAQAQTQESDRKFLDDTRNSYSVLRRQGLDRIQASVFPNWQNMLKDLPPAKRTQAMRLANRLRFSVEADAKGGIRVTHTITGPKPDKGTADALDNIAKGVDLSVTGFLMSWAPFMLSYLIPENLDHFVLQDLNEQRLLTFTQGSVDVSIAITKDFEIKELRTPQGAIKPLLTRRQNGFLLVGYEGDNEDPVVGNVVVKARIESVSTQGMMLPRTVFLNGSAGKSPINVEFQFMNYVLRKRA